MSCEKYELFLIERSDAPGGLPSADAAQLASHLDTCAACRGFARELEDVTPEKLRAELPAKDPGDAFFVRTRNIVWEGVQEQKRASAPARLPAPTESGAKAGFFARLYETLFVQKRGLAMTGVAIAAVAAITVGLWPRAVRPPPFVEGAPPAIDQMYEGEGVLAEIGTLSGDEMGKLANKLVIETPADLRGADLGDDEPDAVEQQIETLSPDELKAFDAKIALATKEAKGA